MGRWLKEGKGSGDADTNNQCAKKAFLIQGREGVCTCTDLIKCM